MDKELQKLARIAKSSGDYTDYDRALYRAGLYRVVMHKLWLIRADSVDMSVCSTNWSEDRRDRDDFVDFQIEGTTTYMRVPREGLHPEEWIRGGWNGQNLYIILEVETKQFITKSSHLKRSHADGFKTI